MHLPSIPYSAKPVCLSVLVVVGGHFRHSTNPRRGPGRVQFILVRVDWSVSLLPSPFSRLPSPVSLPVRGVLGSSSSFQQPCFLRRQRHSCPCVPSCSCRKPTRGRNHSLPAIVPCVTRRDNVVRLCVDSDQRDEAVAGQRSRVGRESSERQQAPLGRPNCLRVRRRRRQLSPAAFE